MTGSVTRMPEPARGALKDLLLDQVAAAAPGQVAAPGQGASRPGRPVGRPSGRLLVVACGAAVVAATVTAAVHGAGGPIRTVAADCYTARVAPAAAPALAVRVVSVHTRVTGGPATAVAVALADCARLWRTGRLDGVARDAAEVPRLVACRAPEHRLAVYPGGDSTCRQLGLASA